MVFGTLRSSPWVLGPLREHDVGRLIACGQSVLPSRVDPCTEDSLRSRNSEPYTLNPGIGFGVPLKGLGF